MKTHFLKLLVIIFFSFNAVQVLGQMSGYYQENFEGVFPPDNWQVMNVLDPSYYWQHSPYTVYSGNYSVYNGSAIGQGEDWLILPQFSVEATDSFSFWFTAESLGFTDSTLILVSTTDDNPESFTSVLAILSDGVNYPTIANHYQYYAYSLSAFAGQDIYVAFKNRNYEGDGVYIDLVSIGSPIGTSIPMVTNNSLAVSISPNPIKESASISFRLQQASQVKISVVDLTGKEVAELSSNLLPAGVQEITWDASAYPAGIYFCRVIVNENIATYRFVKGE